MYSSSKKQITPTFVLWVLLEKQCLVFQGNNFTNPMLRWWILCQLNKRLDIYFTSGYLTTLLVCPVLFLVNRHSSHILLRKFLYCLSPPHIPYMRQHHPWVTLSFFIHIYILYIYIYQNTNSPQGLYNTSQQKSLSKKQPNKSISTESQIDRKLTIFVLAELFKGVVNRI